MKTVNAMYSNSLQLSWSIIKNKTEKSFSELLNRKVNTFPKRIAVNDAVTGEKAKIAAISIKARLHLNVDKGSKALYLLG
jgi:hypothetical protein